MDDQQEFEKLKAVLAEQLRREADRIEGLTYEDYDESEDAGQPTEFFNNTMEALTISDQAWELMHDILEDHSEWALGKLKSELKIRD